MILARSPLRVGLAGGGSDIPEHFRRLGGAVLGMAIAKYVYVALLPLGNTSSENVRFTYRITQSVSNPSELHHPVVRHLLGKRDSCRLNIATMSDIPGGSGLGSSSAFTAAMISVLATHDGKTLTRRELAEWSIQVERVELGEAGGWQDQLQSVHGGLRLYEFDQGGFHVHDQLDAPWTHQLHDSLVLVHAGLPPRQSGPQQASLKKIINSSHGSSKLNSASRVARDGYQALSRVRDVSEALDLMSTIVKSGWSAKAATLRETHPKILALIQEGMSRGATAAKLCGAGGGGYILFVLPAGAAPDFVANWPEVHYEEVTIARTGTETIVDTRKE